MNMRTRAEPVIINAVLGRYRSRKFPSIERIMYADTTTTRSMDRPSRMPVAANANPKRRGMAKPNPFMPTICLPITMSVAAMGSIKIHVMAYKGIPFSSKKLVMKVSAGLMRQKCIGAAYSYRQRIGCIVRFGYLLKFQERLYHFLNLHFIRFSVSCHSLLYLEGYVLSNKNIRRI